MDIEKDEERMVSYTGLNVSTEFGNLIAPYSTPGMYSGKEELREIFSAGFYVWDVQQMSGIII